MHSRKFKTYPLYLDPGLYIAYVNIYSLIHMQEENA